MQGESRRLLELLPIVANVALLRTLGWYRGGQSDHACIIDRPSSTDGLIIASSSGHGIGLAPAFGKAVSELVVSGRSSIPIDGLSLARFQGLEPNWAQTRRLVPGEYNT